MTSPTFLSDDLKVPRTIFKDPAGNIKYRAGFGHEAVPNQAQHIRHGTTNRHTTILNDSGSISACFDDDPKLLNCEVAQPSSGWVYWICVCNYRSVVWGCLSVGIENSVTDRRLASQSLCEVDDRLFWVVRAAGVSTISENKSVLTVWPDLTDKQSLHVFRGPSLRGSRSTR